MARSNNPAATPTIRKQPVVYGYLRAEVPDELEIALWRKEIGLFCERQGYTLASIFTDRGVQHDQLGRPGLDGLLDVLAIPETYGFVVPSKAHLSLDNGVLVVLGLLISNTDAAIIVMDEHPGDVSVWW
ncbi:hypothetical protein [Saccharothrix sp.]|uniref:hypothetical protein n=1 Tax=Saccharothrix sp. TaxID=1873460 RepID=UPI002811B5E5|nr:hypothetical protein [Saccharothrix sp.]